MKDGKCFWSWQSDLPFTRSFIEQALNKAIKELNKENVLRIEARPDKALKGAAGAVRIDHDIFERIDGCEVFVGDVTQVTARNAEGHPSPNACVLVEIGYAARCLGWNHIILPFNSRYGKPEDQPFDLDKHRLLLFECDENADAHIKSSVQKTLVDDFKKAITAILGLPTLKDEFKTFLEKTNPEILKQVRYGRNQIDVNISASRLDELDKFLRHPRMTEFVEIRPNGNTLANATNSNRGINDSTALGSLNGFTLMFNGDLSSW